MIYFDPIDHSYNFIESFLKEYPLLNKYQARRWVSVTTAVSLFKQPFDAVTASEKASKSRKSKWYKLDPVQIRAIWQGESERACETGNWLHEKREQDLYSEQEVYVPGYNKLSSGQLLSVIPTVYDSAGFKQAGEQKLAPGIYPEHIVYLLTEGISGQIDRLEITAEKVVNIIDYKTNKEIKTQSYTSWDGVSQRMAGRLSHLDDCNFMHYSLQLSLYMYMVLRHNRNAKPGLMQIEHITFEELGRDQYDYPILKTQPNGDYIVKSVDVYPVQYMEREVKLILDYVTEHRIQIERDILAKKK